MGFLGKKCNMSEHWKINVIFQMQRNQHILLDNLPLLNQFLKWAIISIGHRMQCINPAEAYIKNLQSATQSFTLMIKNSELCMLMPYQVSPTSANFGRNWIKKGAVHPRNKFEEAYFINDHRGIVWKCCMVTKIFKSYFGSNINNVKSHFWKTKF